jgi:dTDP-4-dehydrorhamnose reductase
MRVLVTGTQGQVARALLAHDGEALAGGRVAVRALGRPDLDLADAACVERALAGAACDVIVNAAAYTAVDRAEGEPDLALAVNGAGAGAVARAAALLGVPVIQLSTDYVFSGDLDRPYREDDPTGPVGAYGRSKLAGEIAVARAGPDHAILRTAWVHGPHGHNFVRTMLRLAATRDEVRVVADQWGAPTPAGAIAQGVLAVAANLLARPGEAALRGVFHMTSAPAVTWADFARAVFAASAARGGPTARVVDIATSDYPTPARRPANSRLACERLARAHGVVLPDWRTMLGPCVAAILADEPPTETRS